MSFTFKLLPTKEVPSTGMYHQLLSKEKAKGSCWKKGVRDPPRCLTTVILTPAWIPPPSYVDQLPGSIDQSKVYCYDCWECNDGIRIAIEIRQKVVLSINGKRMPLGRVCCCSSLPYSTCIFICGNSICILVVMRYHMYIGHSWMESALVSWDAR